VRTLPAVLLTVLALLLASPTVAVADPTPPPGPPVVDARAEAASLVVRLSQAESALEDLRDHLGTRQELANRAFADETAARARADAAVRSAADARTRADTAALDADRARARVDAWLGAWFQQADVLGPFSVLAGTRSPDEVAEREQLRALATEEQRADLDAAELARVAAANENSTARAARTEADAAAARARNARTAADDELTRVRAETDAAAARVGTLTAERDGVAARLRILEEADPAVAAQRVRAEAFTTAVAARDAGTEARVREAARTGMAVRAAPAARPSALTTTAPPAGGLARTALDDAGVDTTGLPDEVVLVLERALSQLGTVYAWGGGDKDGPTRGIPDGGVADSFGDFDKTGFDCSGLMMYAFGGVGKDLPHYSGYQAEAGVRVPLAERRPGDLLFYADDQGLGAVHHVALYVGGDRMVEAPQSGKVVRIAEVRFTGELLPTVTRLL
jgi:cell wall-associated NlpC family hydrolase